MLGTGSYLCWDWVIICHVYVTSNILKCSFTIYPHAYLSSKLVPSYLSAWCMCIHNFHEVVENLKRKDVKAKVWWRMSDITSYFAHPQFTFTFSLSHLTPSMSHLCNFDFTTKGVSAKLQVASSKIIHVLNPLYNNNTMG